MERVSNTITMTCYTIPNEAVMQVIDYVNMN